MNKLLQSCSNLMAAGCMILIAQTAQALPARAPAAPYPHSKYTAVYAIDDQQNNRTPFLTVCSDGRGCLYWKKPTKKPVNPEPQVEDYSRLPVYVNTVPWDYQLFEAVSVGDLTYEGIYLWTSRESSRRRVPLGSRVVDGHKCHGWGTRTKVEVPYLLAPHSKEIRIDERWFDDESHCLVLQESRSKNADWIFAPEETNRAIRLTRFVANVNEISASDLSAPPYHLPEGTKWDLQYLFAK